MNMPPWSGTKATTVRGSSVVVGVVAMLLSCAPVGLARTQQLRASQFTHGGDALLLRQPLPQAQGEQLLPSNDAVLRHLVDASRYDRDKRPYFGEAPVNVSARAFIYIVQSYEGRHNHQLKLNMKLQLGFRDPRLEYAHLSPRTNEIAGGEELARKLWTPHVFIANERHSFLMSSGADKDILVRMFPDGHVLFVTRLTVRIVCNMTYGHFPFDSQECPLEIESWLEDSEELVLHWSGERDAATRCRDKNCLSLLSFSMSGMKTEALVRPRFRPKELLDFELDVEDRPYWTLKLTFSIERRCGFFIMDYYLPSILLVFISWVSFWLEPDMIPARVLLGSSTMLTFITLAVKTDEFLPVSYLKASEIWFLGCCTFIFGSLVEFAFVNTIWRQGQSVEVKKVSTRHILRSTLGTPRPARSPRSARSGSGAGPGSGSRSPRRRLEPQERYVRRRTSSLPDLFHPQHGQHGQQGLHSRRPGRTGTLGGGLGGLDLGSGSDPSYYNTINVGALRRPRLASVCESSETLAMDEVTVSQQPRGLGEGNRDRDRDGVQFRFNVTEAKEADNDLKVPRLPTDGPPLSSSAPCAASEAGSRRQSLSAALMSRLTAVRGRSIAVSLTPGFTRMSAQEVSEWIDTRSRVFFPMAFFVFNLVYWTSTLWLK